MSKPRLLSIIELGGYPNLVPLYQKSGYEVDLVNSQRKARSYLKKTTPNVIVAEFNYQTDFRDRSSNLETLMSIVQKQPDIKVIVFYPANHQDKLYLLTSRFDIHATLPLPVDQARLSAILVKLAEVAV